MTWRTQPSLSIRIVNGKRVEERTKPLIVDGNQTVRGNHNRNVVVRTGNVAITGHVNGNLAVEHGARTHIRGTINGDVEIDADAVAFVSGSVNGSVRVSRGAALFIEGTVNGTLSNLGITTLRGLLNGEATGNGSLVLDGGRVGTRRVLADGTVVYEG